MFGAAGNANTYAVNVYRARISSAIMMVDGVVNVTGVLLNSRDADLVLTQTERVQQLPVDGTVTLNAV